MSGSNIIFNDKKIKKSNFYENKKVFNMYDIPPGNKASWRRCNDVALYVPATSQVRLK